MRISASCLAQLTLLFTAAGPAAAEPVTIKLWHSYTGAERTGLEQALEAFAATSPGFTVAPSFVPNDALVDKLTAAIPRGHGPDVFIFAHDRVGGWAEGHLIEPIELLVDEPMLDRHVTACVFALAYGDSLYGLPLAFKALALFVRTDQLKAAPKTFEELLAAARAATDKSAGRYGLVYPNADLFFHTPLLFSLGGRIYAGGDEASPNVVNDGVVRSLAMAHRLATVEGVIPDDPSTVLSSAMFVDGRTPLVISGPWFRSQIDEGVPYTVAPIPAFEGGEQAAGFSTCEGVLMSRRSAHKKEGFRLMRFLTTEAEGVRPRMIAGQQTVSLLSAWETDLPMLPERERAIYAAFREAFERSKPTPSHPSMNAVWTPMNAALYKTIHRGMAPADAAREAQERIEKALRKSN